MTVITIATHLSTSPEARERRRRMRLISSVFDSCTRTYYMGWKPILFAIVAPTPWDATDSHRGRGLTAPRGCGR